MLDRKVETIKMSTAFQHKFPDKWSLLQGQRAFLRICLCVGGGGGGGSIYRKEPYYTKCGEMTDGCW